MMVKIGYRDRAFLKHITPFLIRWRVDNGQTNYGRTVFVAEMAGYTPVNLRARFHRLKVKYGVDDVGDLIDEEPTPEVKSFEDQVIPRRWNSSGLPHHSGKTASPIGPDGELVAVRIPEMKPTAAGKGKNLLGDRPSVSLHLPFDRFQIHRVDNHQRSTRDDR